MSKWTEAQIELAEQWLALIEQDKDAEADKIWEQLDRELGPEGRTELLEYIEERHERPEPKKKASVLKPARRVSQSAEHWRCLSNYPAYEISSHGRVRAIDRAKPGDWLKPRYKWILGKAVSFVVIRDRDGRRCERMVGKLLIAAGFMPKPAWMEKRSGDETV